MSNSSRISRIIVNKIYNFNNLREKITKNINIRLQYSTRDKEILNKIQHDLFDIGGELSIPNHMKINDKKISFLENTLDSMNKELPPLKEFILPGGSKVSSYCHLARTVCRRVERNLFKLR